MATFIKGLIVGVTVTTAALGGYAYGTSRQQSDIPDLQEAAELEATCRVNVGFARMSIGDQCPNDQVMVGTRNGYLLCADLQVSCP